MRATESKRLARQAGGDGQGQYVDWLRFLMDVKQLVSPARTVYCTADERALQAHAPVQNPESGPHPTKASVGGRVSI